jgi:hypothetical protein
VRVLTELKILLLVMTLGGLYPAHADVLELQRAGPTCDPQLRACTLLLQISGEITDSTAQRVRQIIDQRLRQAEANNYTFAFLGVELNSPGGSVGAAMTIGRIIRKEQASAAVPRGSTCLSACVLILAGASYRGLEGTIGIHRPYFQVPRADISPNDVGVAYSQMLQNMRDYFREMNVTEDLADAMLRINPEHMRVLNLGEMTQFGLTEVDPAAQETFELQQAQSLGIDRQEYMRRKSLAEQRCGGPASLGTYCYRNILKSGRAEQVDFSRYGRIPQQSK